MEAVIAHISDVHHDRKDPGVSDRLARALAQARPSMLLVTGDLADNPWTLRAAKKWLLTLCTACGLSPDKQLLVVPGNHDIGALGNVGFKPLTGWWFRRHLGSYFDPVRIIEEHNLTVISIDSNPLVSDFARGDIGQAQLSRIQRELDGDDQRTRIANTVKVAILHHHPFPVPFVRSKVDEFLVLRNVHRLLQFLADNKIEIVLHGHNHMAPHSVLSLGTCLGTVRAVEVIGAGTAVARGDREERGHSFNLLAVGENGLSYVRQFFARPGEDFREMEASGSPSQGSDSAFIRGCEKIGYKYGNMHWDAVLDEEGDIFNEISYERLRPTCARPLLSIQPPPYTVDTGHMSKVWLNAAKTSEGVTVENLSEDEPRRTEFRVNFTDPPTPEQPLNYSLRSYDFNAVSLSRSEYRRKFPTRKFVREYSEIEISVPVEEFSWVLRFPPGYRLPHPPRFEVMTAGDVRHKWLSQSLHTAFRYSDNLDLCFVRIHRPPIDCRYRISWELPEETNTSADDLVHSELVARATQALLSIRTNTIAHTADPRKEQIEEVLLAFREMACNRIENLLGKPGILRKETRENIEVSLMAYDEGNGTAVPELRVVAATHADLHHSLNFSLEIGDGNAGRSYKTNRVRIFDRSNTTRQSKQETYVRRKGEAAHWFLCSVPLHHPESQHHIVAVLNIGSYERDEGNFLRNLGKKSECETLTDVGQSYVLKRLMEILKIDL